MWPVGTPSCCLWSFLCGPISPGVLSCFLAQQNIPGHLVLSLLQTLSHSFLQGALVFFYWGWVLRNQDLGAGVFAVLLDDHCL